ncbi:hypothetical protein KCP73_02600 [Salmonella enterica subsp. enterica]|nr:hypothetical protein KCP73_02600 [Salmonella enterica subsp. enterica]
MTRDATAPFCWDLADRRYADRPFYGAKLVDSPVASHIDGELFQIAVAGFGVSTKLSPSCLHYWYCCCTVAGNQHKRCISAALSTTW